MKNVKVDFGTWRENIFMVAGCVLQAISVAVFLGPADIASGGISGLAIVLVRQFPLPISIGLLTLLINLPLFWLGLRFLGGWRFLARTIFSVIVFTSLTAYLESLHLTPLTNDVMLNTLFGAVIGGFGAGLVILARATTGGTDIMALLLLRWRSLPISQGYLITDAVVIIAAGLVFGWEKALYALIGLYVGGIATEATAEGAHVSRTAIIITQRPEEVAQTVLNDMGRGLTRWAGTGGYSGQERPILFVVISRPETAILKRLVAQTDPGAFVVIGHAQEVYGEGFRQFGD
jgi:uncharacterized membrane-anchored protein YitT (DUF2179 family)